MSNWLEDFVYRIDLDAGFFLSSLALTAMIAFLAVMYQSTRAALMNPVKVLRQD